MARAERDDEATGGCRVAAYPVFFSQFLSESPILPLRAPFPSSPTPACTSYTYLPHSEARRRASAYGRCGCGRSVPIRPRQVGTLDVYSGKVRPN